MRRFLSTALAITSIAMGAGSAGAQTGQRWSIQGSGLYAGLFGTAFDEIKDGIGGEVQLRFTPGVWSFGGGVQYTQHNTSGDTEDVLSKVKLLGVFIEPRYVLDIGSSRAAPYLSGRFALSKMTFDVNEDFAGPNIEFDVGEPTGPTINGGGGVLLRIGSRANLDVGATYGYTKFKNIAIQATNTETGQTATATVRIGSGTNLVLRVGFAIGLGR